MKNKMKTIIVITVFFIGFLIFIYPTVSKGVSNYLIQKTIFEYKQDIKSILKTSNEENELFNKMQSYNEKIYSEGQDNLIDPFSYEVPSFDLLEIGFNNNIIGYLTIPKIDIEIPVYLGATQENKKKGAAHLTQTSIPIGGINTNSVISAHRGMKTHPMFRDIEMLEIGDEVKITNMWGELIYKVIETKIIRPDEISEVLIQEGRDLITLVTCHPYTKNYQRYVVYCERQENITNELEVVLEESDIGNENKPVGLSKESAIENKRVYDIANIENIFRDIGIFLIVLFLGYVFYRTIRKRESKS